MYHTRECFAYKCSVAAFDVKTHALLALRPMSEIALLAGVLTLDDRDGDLTNGTPNMANMFYGIHARHGIPWPAPITPAKR